MGIAEELLAGLSTAVMGYAGVAFDAVCVRSRLRPFSRYDSERYKANRSEWLRERAIATTGSWFGERTEGYRWSDLDGFAEQRFVATVYVN